MKSICKIAGAVAILFSTFIAGIPYMSGVPEAQAFRGRGAAFVVGAAVGSAAASNRAPAPAPAQVTVVNVPPPAAAPPPPAK